MKIGIIGSGNVGGTLGSRWAQGGHSVIFGSRNPASDELASLVTQAGSSARAASFKDAVADSEVVLIATPWPATEKVLQSIGSLGDRIIIDATNPLLPDLSGLAVGTDNSAGEQVAAWTGCNRVVKAFNTVGFNIMANPVLDGDPVLLFYCGDDLEAKRVVSRLASELGFDAKDAGPLNRARLLEPFAMLWIKLAMTPGHGRDFAFRMIGRN